MVKEFTPQQIAAKELIRCDLRYVFTIFENASYLKSNYVVSMIPYFSLVVDGAEAWVAAMNSANPGVIEAPRFSKEEKLFYDTARESIKLWEMPYEKVFKLLERHYAESDAYFSSLCKPIAKRLRLYDIFGADLTENGHFCGNTILDAIYLPGYNHGDSAYGPNLRNMTVIGGKYVRIFNAMESYATNKNRCFHYRDYGGFEKSPVGNAFSYRFVLFSILCQVNFILYAVDRYIEPEVPTKLRFAYILYYYLCDILPQINARHGTLFMLNRFLYSQEFRNAMAHYKVGVYLKKDEIVIDDPMYGMTQKAFGMDFYQTKNEIIRELENLSEQLEVYLARTKGGVSNHN